MIQTQVVKKAIWLTRLLSELNIDLRLSFKSVLIKADNQSVIALTSDPRFYTRIKHIDIQWHFVRDQMKTETVLFEWISTREITADGLIKALSKDKFDTFIGQLGLKKSV